MSALFMIVEFNQASGQPRPIDEFYDSYAEAEKAAEWWAKTAARYGRRETYGIAEVSILSQDEP